MFKRLFLSDALIANCAYVLGKDNVPQCFILGYYSIDKYLRALCVICSVIKTQEINICSIKQLEPGEKHWPVISRWQTLSHNVVIEYTSPDWDSNISWDRHWLHR
jgi:hypothetical protein